MLFVVGIGHTLNLEQRTWEELEALRTICVWRAWLGKGGNSTLPCSMAGVVSSSLG